MTNYPRIVVRESELEESFLSSPDAGIPEHWVKRVEGQTPGPWPVVAERVGGLDAMGHANVARALYGSLDISRRVAADPAFWHYGSLFHLRDYVFARWAPKSGERKGRVHANRLLGQLTRNALSSLYWSIDMLDADGRAEESLIEDVFAGSGRFRLWLIDFNSFHGRPWLARLVWKHLFPPAGPRSTDREVDEFFRALGKLSHVRLFDLYEERQEELIHMVQESLPQSEEAKP